MRPRSTAATPPLTPDRQTARQWLDQELSRPEYADRLSWWHRLQRWLDEQLSGIGPGAGSSGVALWIALGLMVLTAVVLALSVGRWRSGAITRASSDQGIFTDQTLTAADHRERAEQSLGRGEHPLAVQEAFRAITRDLQERTIVPERAGLTATEVAVTAAPVFPALAARIDQAAGLFNEVTYGHLIPSPEQAHHTVHLSRELARTRPGVLQGAT